MTKRGRYAHACTLITKNFWVIGGTYLCSLCSLCVLPQPFLLKRKGAFFAQFSNVFVFIY
jgi:hypothetical protein